MNGPHNMHREPISMPESVRTATTKDQLPRELLELRTHLDLLPPFLRDKLTPLCERLSHFVRLQGRLVRIAQDAVDQLQLDVKYLTFDLEATRRERDGYRKELEEE
jgi:hypothetical protein